MVVRIVLWNLNDSKTTIEELRRYLRDESVDEFAEVEGLRFKAWISDPAGERWGAFYLFESLEASEQALPGRARELIGKSPDVVEIFDLEATVEGAMRTRSSRDSGLRSSRSQRLTTKVLEPSARPYVRRSRVPRAAQTYQR